MKKISGPDLRKAPPRSPRVRLGEFVILARILDKCRATILGCQGDYEFNCPMDQRFFAFIGVKSAAFKKQVATGKGDGAVYQWIIKQIVPRLSHTDILAWSQFQEQRTPGDLDSREFFHGLHQKAAPHREDIHTWFDLLDIDDYVSFGGNA